jgi:hypothetical protein
MDSMNSYSSSAEKYNQCLKNKEAEIDTKIQFLKEAKKKCYQEE